MKPVRSILIVLGVMVLAVAPMLVIDSYKARKCAQEAKRIMQARLKLVERLEDYQHTTGRYPDSIEGLSFTNSPEENRFLPDIQQIHHRRTVCGYALEYEGAYGYHFSDVSTIDQ